MTTPINTASVNNGYPHYSMDVVRGFQDRGIKVFNGYRKLANNGAESIAGEGFEDPQISVGRTQLQNEWNARYNQWANSDFANVNFQQIVQALNADPEKQLNCFYVLGLSSLRGAPNSDRDRILDQWVITVQIYETLHRQLRQINGNWRLQICVDDTLFQKQDINFLREQFKRSYNTSVGDHPLLTLVSNNKLSNTPICSVMFLTFKPENPIRSILGDAYDGVNEVENLPKAIVCAPPNVSYPAQQPHIFSGDELTDRFQNLINKYNGYSLRGNNQYGFSSTGQSYFYVKRP